MATVRTKPHPATPSARGSGLSFEEFVASRLPHLLRFGRALTGDDHAAADLVQDALERTYVKWQRIRSADPEGYVRTVMVNRHVSLWRKLRRERVMASPPDVEFVDEHADPELLAALRRLAPRQRAVVALRYYEDLTEAQTAQVLGCSVGTVKRQASDAMSHLRRLLDQDEVPS